MARTAKVVTDNIKLTREELEAIRRGEFVYKKRGTNIMGEDLVIRIRLKK